MTSIELPFLGPMSEDEYFAYPALSQSSLKLMGRTPWHYHNKPPPDKYDTPAKKFGRLFHTLLLEPDTFDAKYRVCDWNHNTKAFKELAELESREFVTTAHVEKADAMSRAIMANEDAREFIMIPSEPEICGICELFGRIVKIRIDRLPKVGQLWDIKTFGGEARPRAFTYRCRDYGYFMQAWLYSHVYEVITGEHRGWSWIVVENSDRPAVQVYQAHSSLLDEGRMEFEKLLNLLEECEALDSWPNSYTQGPYTILGREELP